MFSCKACPCKDEHISSLKKEIEFLKRLNSPSPQLPQINIDENFLLNGSGTDRPEDPTIDPEEQENIQREQDRILAGTYDNY
jgi:hypothetical protein